MNHGDDLTRWNRAGLRRFRYIDGNAAEYLESLRFLLADQFPAWTQIQSSGSAFADENQDAPLDPQNWESDRLARVLAQYYDDRRDLAWEICRSFARACHVLAEHIDAYANESYLGTATQWDNVRRLVEMLDYHPAPPASAATRLVLTAKEGRQGVVKKGFQIKHTPPEGGPPVIFETLEDITVDAELNELRLKNYNRSPSVLSGTTIVVEGKQDELNIGEPVVLEKETPDGSAGFSQAGIIAGLAVGQDRTAIKLSPAISPKHKFIQGWTLVHLQPKEKLNISGPAMSGVKAPGQQLEESPLYLLRLEDAPAALNAGDIVYISDTERTYYRRVEKIKGRRIYINGAIGPIDLQKAYVSRARHLPVVGMVARDPKADDADIFALRVSGDLSYLQNSRVADVRTVVSRSDAKLIKEKEISDFIVRAAVYIQPGEEGGGYTILKLLDSEHKLVNPQAILVKPLAVEWRLDAYLKNDVNQPFETTLVIDKPKKTSAGDFAVVVSENQYAWGNVSSVSDAAESTRSRLTVGHWYHRGGGRYYLKDTRLFGHFKKKLRPMNWQNNAAPVRDSRLVLKSIPAGLFPGKRLMLEKIEGENVSDSSEVWIKEIDQNDIIIDKSLTGKGYTCHNLVLRGNVVAAGHGERKPAKVLGSGRATMSGQTFTLKVNNVSFVADATQTAGVRADIEVMVGDQIWEPVSSFNYSSPTDPHYVVRMTEDGFIGIGFGDGINGRRLPTGNNNVRVDYRVGTGLSGNLPAGSLVKPLKPHPLVKTVDQPLAATGGNNMEDTESLRQSAPATLLTLERAVSLADFANLAASHSSVWQARAFRQTGSRGFYELVEIVAVPADGTALGNLKDSLRDFVQTHAVPHVNVSISEFERVWLDLTIDVAINTAEFETDKVKQAILSDLTNAFSLKKRRIGQALYLGEVYSIVESAAGVIHSTCFIAVGGYTGHDEPRIVRGTGRNIKLIRPNKRQVVFIDPEKSSIVV